MRFIKPFKTLPGPISIARPQPNAASFFTDSSQRTGRYRLLDQQRFHPIGRQIDVGFDVGHDADGEWVGRKYRRERAVKPSAAGRMSWQ